MARSGQDSEKLVCVVSTIVLDHTQEHVLLGARRKTPNENRHLDTISTFTRAVPREIFNLLAGGNPSQWKNGKELFSKSDHTLSVGSGEHGESSDVYATESVLAKAGLSAALIEGSITGHISPALRSLSRVEDKDTGKSQLTAMLHYKAVLSSDSDLTAIPLCSAAYEPIAWVDTNKLVEAYAAHDANILEVPRFDELFLCLGGACIDGAVHTLSS